MVQCPWTIQPKKVNSQHPIRSLELLADFFCGLPGWSKYSSNNQSESEFLVKVIFIFSTCAFSLAPFSENIVNGAVVLYTILVARTLLFIILFHWLIISTPSPIMASFVPPSPIQKSNCSSHSRKGLTSLQPRIQSNTEAYRSLFYYHENEDIPAKNTNLLKPLRDFTSDYETASEASSPLFRCTPVKY